MAEAQTISDAESIEPRSTIACKVCRKRKVKCDRELPHCSICNKSMQRCEYPEKSLRPGPRIGSTQVLCKKRKRQTNHERPPSQDFVRTPSISQSDHEQESKSQQPVSTRESPPPNLPAKQAVDMQSLSFIIHPSHESYSPTKRRDDSTLGSMHRNNHASHVAASCRSLGIDSNYLGRFIDYFFDNFTSFQLFRQSSFSALLQRIETATQCKALLASVLVFACKGMEQAQDAEVQSQAQSAVSDSYFSAQALNYVDLAIQECEDEPLPLPLLQALILVTHWLLIQGVRGRAWRYLGIAIRSAYEMNLHLIDAETESKDMSAVDPAQWCDEEEQRRAWWAIWEMDVFASVIRRCPTGIDWSQNETFLPAEDERWNRGVPQQSCTLRLDSVERYKALEISGNQSQRAWFIVINSLMKDAQKLSSPIGLQKSSTVTSHSADRSDVQTKSVPSNSGRRNGTTTSKDCSNRLRTIRNALQCTTLALPHSLKYRGQYLSFGSRDTDRQTRLSQKTLHSSIYNIHMMTQLTKLVIYKSQLFKDGPGTRSFYKSDKGKTVYSSVNIEKTLVDANVLEQYSQAAEEIVSLIGQSFEEHYRYVNPFLANTIWLAGAVQLVHRELAPLTGSDKELTNSNIELLSLTYNRFVNYWSMSPTLEKNLTIVEEELRNLKHEAQKAGKAQKKAQPDVGERINSPTSRRDAFGRLPKSDLNVGRFMMEQEFPKVRNDGTANGTIDEESISTAYAITASRSTDPENLNHLHSAVVGIQNTNWSDNSSNQFQPNAGQFGASSTRLLDTTSTQQQQQAQLPGPLHHSAISRPSTYADTFVNPASASMQMPISVGTMSSNDSMQQDNSPSIFQNANGQQGLSPDYLDGMSFPQDFLVPDVHLSDYLGRMLSGAYMP